MRLRVAIILLGACSIPEKHLVDAEGPYSCLNQPLPTSADSKITITGLVKDLRTDDPVPDSQIQGFLVGVNTAIFTTATATDTNDPTTLGTFSQDQATGGSPLDAYLRASKNGYLDTFFHPAAPLTTNYSNQIEALTIDDLTTLAAVGGVTLDPSLAQILVVVRDCTGMPIGGATVSSQPSGTIRYFVNATPSASATATDSQKGVALILNTPVSNTTINAEVLGMTLRSHNMDTVGGATIQTEIRP
jgi:hypothetical protein